MKEQFREELIAYDKWLTRRKWGTGEIISPEKAADLYLAEHPIPPAEGAEEITAEEFIREKIKQKYGLSDEEMTGSLGLRCTCTGRDASKWAQEFATLHAQKIADKMVEDMRQKLFSMRSTKEAMYKLSEADRLMQYGYHDCINEMLMWTKKLSHD